MTLSATYWLYCNVCNIDAGGGKPTTEEVYQAAEAAGWYVKRSYQVAVCEECKGDKIVHVQASNIFCVCCLNGEHLQIIV